MGIFKIIGGWLGGVFASVPIGPVTPGPGLHPAGRTFTVVAESRRFTVDAEVRIV